MIPVQHNIELMDTINMIEAQILAEPQVECPLDHIFTDGMYVRQVTIPAGTKVSGQTQAKQHPFFLSEGVLEIFIPGEGFRLHIAPFLGVTEAGTKRLARTLTKTVWTTFHRTNIKPKDNTFEGIMEAVAEVEKEIFEPVNNPFTKMEVLK